MSAASSSCSSVRIDGLDPLAGPCRNGTSDCADEVTLSRKGAKSRTRVPSLRSTGTKASTDVDRLRASNADLEKKLAEALEQQTATSEVLASHCKLARRTGAGVPGHAGERGAHLRSQLRRAEFREDGGICMGAMHNVPPAFAEFLQARSAYQPTSGSLLERVMRTKQVGHIGRQCR